MVMVTVCEKNVRRLADKLVRRKILHRIRNASQGSASWILSGDNLLAQHITEEILSEFAGFRVSWLFLRRLVRLAFFKYTVEIFDDGMERFVDGWCEDAASEEDFEIPAATEDVSVE